jgi:hypothetical protein
VRGRKDFSKAIFYYTAQSTAKKFAKMTGVTLRCKWITGVMFMGPGQRARPPLREAILKKYIHIT